MAAVEGSSATVSAIVVGMVVVGRDSKTGVSLVVEQEVGSVIWPLLFRCLKKDFFTKVCLSSLGPICTTLA